jgi:phage gp16-like protein
MTDRARTRVAFPARQQGKTLATAIEANAAVMRQKVQIGRKQLGLADEDYRAILLRVTGHTTSTACNVRELDALLREFARLGFKPAPVRKFSPKAQVRMIHAIYADIQPLLAVGGPEALRSFVRRQTKSDAHPHGIDAPEFLDAEQATKVVEGLKAWRTRLRRSQGGVA